MHGKGGKGHKPFARIMDPRLMCLVAELRSNDNKAEPSE